MNHVRAYYDVKYFSATYNYEICALLGYNTASSGDSLMTFRDNILVPSSRVKKSKKSRKLFYSSWTLPDL
jgi:hypothetical protein